MTTPRRYRLLLINPFQKYKHYATQPEMCHLMGKRTTMSPLALTTIAALTPAHYDIRIIDEEIEKLPADLSADIVGITALTNTINRCYEIADRFRSRGVAVVLGGPYISFAVEEGLQHADSIVVGEAEGSWQRCLEDFEAARLQRTYTAEHKDEFATAPIPRWDLIDTSKVVCIPIEVSRGCPYNCEFCLVTKMFGRRMRYRDIDNVMAEIAASPLRSILFVDDNLTVNKTYARELMRRLKPLGISWTCQASLELAKEPELLHEMAEAGCENIIIGFESMNPQSLHAARKYHNLVAEYRAAIDAIHNVGIMTFGSFIVGFDDDTLEELDRIVSFAQEAPVPYLMLNLLVPAPGTDLQLRLAEEGRWYGANTDFRGGLFPVVHYMRFGQTELFEAYLAAVKRAYSFEFIRERVLRLFARGTFTRSRRGNTLGPLARVWILARIALVYLTSPERIKRRFFAEVFGLARRGTVSFDKAVGTLVAMEGFHRHLRLLEGYRRDFAPFLAAADKGAWQKTEAAGSKDDGPIAASSVIR
jgi:uncharacterized radical SAM superfamily protein